MTTALATLPPHRVLEPIRFDPEEDPDEYFAIYWSPNDTPEESLAQEEAVEARYQAVAQAICAGTQVRCNSNEAELGLREVCMTKYTDPETGEARYAVEVWRGPHSGKHDFATRTTADQRYGYYLAKLNRPGKPLRGIRVCTR